MFIERVTLQVRFFPWFVALRVFCVVVCSIFSCANNNSNGSVVCVYSFDISEYTKVRWDERQRLMVTQEERQEGMCKMLMTRSKKLDISPINGLQREC